MGKVDDNINDLRKREKNDKHVWIQRSYFYSGNWLILTLELESLWIVLSGYIRYLFRNFLALGRDLVWAKPNTCAV